MSLNSYLILSAFLFCTGIYGVLARKNAVLVLIGRSGTIASSIFRDYLVPFEVVSMLLLAALVGAVVIARRD